LHSRVSFKHHNIYNFYSKYRPKSNEIEDIINIFDAGMSMARLNLSHGTLKQNLKLLNKFKQAKRLRPHKSCGFMVELRGREIRISKILEASNQMKIRAGSIVNLIAGQYDQPSDANNFRINTSEM
jgi:pyruvate kinase